ncbi:MAG: DUF551 domain-containing protein [Bacteroides sp.]|nr:DUF551 domain-containing protein [Bacteroides sp.]
MDRKQEIYEANPYGNSSDIGYGKRLGFITGAEWADAHPKNPWIRVEDRLPDEGQHVLFIIEWRGVHKGYFAGSYKGGKWETEERTYNTISFYGIVTHWMPIPKFN